MYSFLIILLFPFTLSARSPDDLKCIQKNKWQDLINSTKTISDPSDCTSVSKQCCFINITYSYINVNVSSQYCFSLDGNVDKFKEYITNLYQDNIYNFANYTYRNKDKYRWIGRQFDEPFFTNFTCFMPPHKSNYSTYLFQNCGKFDGGKCLFEKDVNYFGNFTEKFYENYTGDYCRKKGDDGKCIKYTGSRANNAMIRPLMLDLIEYLHIDDPHYDYEGENDIVEFNPDDENSIIEKWENCSPIPKVDIQLICPEDFKSAKFIKWNILILFMFIMLYVN